tara:strand:+ start:182 stop:832 length:651 start_codon:yes stop_codon:yes gene_type:complete
MSEVNLNKAVLVGSDANTEWMLPWFVENFKKYNDTHLSIVDFGMTEEAQKWCETNVDSLGDMRVETPHAWFLKPFAMANSPFKKTIWLDIDCEILGDVSPIFSKIVPDKLSMVVDRPWSKRFNTTMYNSGVVAFEGRPKILELWCERIKSKPGRGDQETLHEMLDPLQQMMHINEIENKWNVLRLQHIEGPKVNDTVINHWTGMKGKEHIRSLMNE